MNELTIQLSEVNPTIFYGGSKSKNIAILKRYFPKLKIVARGDTVTAYGEDEILEEFEKQMDRLMLYYGKYNSLDENTVEEILTSSEEDNFGLDSTDNETLLHGVGGKVIKTRTINQARMVEAITTNDLVFAVGPAGTGKTYTGVAMAVKALKNKEVKRIVLTRPAVEAGENLGFLPGDLKEKLDPYMQPLYDALRDMIPAEKLSSYIEKGTIQIAPMAFMRGRTLDNAFVILDEAQNTTHNQMKMFLTRMGKNTKFVITGDPGQIDLPRRVISGLKEVLLILADVKGIEIIYLDGRDVIRHQLVKKVIEAYKKTEHHN
ncbi:MAG: PhoH family protein [Flavobacteriaceae bacterium]|nr:PhoH family protein [Flavobacteriaceae bacterium]MDG0967462.1 PhoH family protein [Flavobacteriaceae bacterium]